MMTPDQESKLERDIFHRLMNELEKTTTTRLLSFGRARAVARHGAGYALAILWVANHVQMRRHEARALIFSEIYSDLDLPHYDTALDFIDGHDKRFHRIVDRILRYFGHDEEPELDQPQEPTIH